MLKLIFKIPLIFCLTGVSAPPPSAFSLVRQYSTTAPTPKILKSLKPLKIYSSLQQPSKRKQLLNDLDNRGGIILFLSQNSSLYAIEGNDNLAGYFQDLFNKEMLKLLANIKIPKARQKKTKIQLKTHYQELLHQGWKDYDLYLLETWKTSEDVNVKQRLVAYHTKYQPKLNLVRYVALANGEIEAVYQWNHFKTEEQLFTASQKKATTKPLLIYRIDDKSPLDKLKGKVYYENKDKTGVYRWVNRLTKESYVDSSLNLGNLLYTIASTQTLSKSKNPLFQQALQQYSLTNFNLQILAYCSKEELAEKEAYYLLLYQPEYNNKLEDKKKGQLIIDNSLDKQLVLFQPPKQSLITSNHSLSLSLTLFKVKPVHLLIREDLTPAAKTKKAWTKSSTKSLTKSWTLSEATRQNQSLAQQKRTKMVIVAITKSSVKVAQKE